VRYLSVCSGIEAATVAWHPLGWQPVAFAEIEKFPSAVLAHHYPSVQNWGDMTKFQEWPDADVDVLVGGTPCQSFSVAGLRKGLADPRGNLALVYLGILDRYRPRWMVWENVPGVLSSNGGRDFGAFLGGLAELGYGFAYRILDAQFFGLAQRRKRVFVVGYLGDWRRAAAVLFEPEGLSGHPAPRREAGKTTAPTLSARTQGGGGLGTDFDCDGGLIAGTIGASSGDWSRDNIGEGLVAFGGNNQTGPIDVATAQTAQTAHGGTGRLDFESETFVCFDETQITSAENRCNPQPGDPSHPLVKGARPPTLAFAIQAGESRENPDSGPDGVGVQDGVAYTIEARAEVQATAFGMNVRRLTPRECERLQGFPDDYSAIPYRGKPAADGPRYKALGNSMAVPVMRRIGEGIADVEAMRRDAA